MRILARSDIVDGLDKLGLAPEDLVQIRECDAAAQRHLPGDRADGSGKTTLLYSCLQEIADSEKKTMTLEDPVEYVLPHMTQVQVNKKAGLTFAAALRALAASGPGRHSGRGNAGLGNGS